MTDIERAANRYAWEVTDDANRAHKLELAFIAGAKWAEDNRKGGDSE